MSDVARKEEAKITTVSLSGGSPKQGTPPPARPHKKAAPPPTKPKKGQAA